ncbi:hypothetical protein GALMADRAFT_766091 [Galerina marginata CBS 339.88]|uniref:Uncharacterized protein n=1 Tax=Galerina marginata (strain CBS 339.88) TaxID=685588 RepID=A0A067SMN5_GALM3|nr:hypothetical protein GALMADRAFT_766091 [Galerina marginata CBS 339.88]
MAPKSTVKHATPATSAGFFVSNASDLNRVRAVSAGAFLNPYAARLESMLVRDPAFFPPPSLTTSAPLLSLATHRSPYQRGRKTSFLDLPAEIQTRIITLVCLIPHNISRPVKRKVTQHESITPSPHSLLRLAASCKTLHDTVFGMQNLFTSLTMEITLRPEVSTIRNFERVRKNIQDDVILMQGFFGKSGGTLPLRLGYSIRFGVDTPASTIDQFNLRAMPITQQLIFNPTFIGRWQVLDLCMPTYAPFTSLLYALAAPPATRPPRRDPVPMSDFNAELSLQASKPSFTSLRMLHLLAPYPPPPGKTVDGEDAVNLFLRFSVGAPLLSSIKLDFCAPLNPLKFSEGVAVQPFFTTNSVMTLHHIAEGARDAADKENMRAFTRNAMKPLWARRKTTFPDNADFAAIRIAQHVQGSQVWWAGLQQLTLSTGTITEKLFYVLAHMIGLQRLDIWLGEDRPMREMAPETTLNIPLPHLTVLIVRCAENLELLRHIHTPKLEGLYLQMRHFELCRKWRPGTPPGPTAFAFKRILGIDPTTFDLEVEKKTMTILRRFFLGYTSRPLHPEAPNPVPLPLRHLKLVALPIRDISVPEMLRSVPKLEELRMWWGPGGSFVEALADATLVPRLSHLELHLAKSRVVPRLVDRLKDAMRLRSQVFELNVSEAKGSVPTTGADWSLCRPTLDDDGFTFVDADGDGMEVDTDLGAPMAVDVIEIEDSDNGDSDLEEGEIREMVADRAGRRQLRHSSFPTDLKTAEYQNISNVAFEPLVISLNLTKQQCPCGTRWMEPEVDVSI